MSAVSTAANRIVAAAAAGQTVQRTSVRQQVSAVLRDAAARPADVLRAVERYRPRYGSLGASDARRAERIVGTAIDDMPMSLVVNRHPASVENVLETGVFNTIHTASELSASGRARRYLRVLRERRLGIHGTGEQAGHTVFASVQFLPAPRGARSTADEGAALVRSSIGTREGLHGYSYGDVAIELKPSVLGRTTFLPTDSFGARSRPGGAEHLPQLIVERLARDAGRVTDRFWGRSGVESAAAGMARAADERPVLEQLVRAPEEQAVEGVRRYLQSDALTKPGRYIEAQVRKPTVDDIAALHLERALDPADERRVRDLAARRGIPVVGPLRS